MNNQNQNNSSLQTTLLFVAVLMLGYLIYTVSGGAPVVYRTPAQPVQQPETGSVIIQEQPAVIVVTGAPPSVPVVAPAVEIAPTATAVPTVTEPVEVAPTHPPLPANMQEAHEQGYWPMPITLEQFEQCQIDPQINPACQFYVEVSP